MSTRHLSTRAREYLHFNSQVSSAIKNHIMCCNVCFSVKLKLNSFKIIKKCKSEFYTKIHKALFIKKRAVFIDLTAAYDTVRHRGLTCKLLRLLPDKHMVKMIMELVRNRSFTLTTGDSKQSRLRRLQNGVPQGSVLASLLFNIYTYDLPSMISRKFAYADNLALLHSSGNLEGILSQDMSTLSAYL